MLSEIMSKLNETKISTMQLDPFGFCNGKCYFCPVKYYGNPRETMVHMDVTLLEKILDDVADERGSLVAGNFDLVYTSHYNEAILYKYFRKLLFLLKERQMKTILLTNGVQFDKDKQAEVLMYKEAVYGVCFNIPSFQVEEWSEMTGFDPARFSDLLDNVERARKLKDAGLDVSIQVNDKVPPRGRGNVAFGQARFPGLNVFGAFGLVDRAGLLRPYGLSNESAIPLEGEVYDCANSHVPGGRQYSWLHVNPRGEVFMCCNDFFMKHKFGDYNKGNLEDFWRTEKHAEVIKGAFETLCTKCAASIWR
jgi:MoaA/NifB/PqqE/SkfB family radical SAM enzyme